MDMHAKWVSRPDAVRVFNKMPSHDILSWTGMVQ